MAKSKEMFSSRLWARKKRVICMKQGRQRLFERVGEANTEWYHHKRTGLAWKGSLTYTFCWLALTIMDYKTPRHFKSLQKIIMHERKQKLLNCEGQLAKSCYPWLLDIGGGARRVPGDYCPRWSVRAPSEGEKRVLFSELSSRYSTLLTVH